MEQPLQAVWGSVSYPRTQTRSRLYCFYTHTETQSAGRMCVLLRDTAAGLWMHMHVIRMTIVTLLFKELVSLFLSSLLYLHISFSEYQSRENYGDGFFSVPVSTFSTTILALITFIRCYIFMFCCTMFFAAHFSPCRTIKLILNLAHDIYKYNFLSLTLQIWLPPHQSSRRRGKK